MDPKDVVTQLKKKGTFDELRKRLLADFQAQPIGQRFRKDLNEFMENLVKNDPSLLEKERSVFHSIVYEELEKTGIYESLRKEVLDTLLQSNDYRSRIAKEISVIVEGSQENKGNDRRTDRV